VVRKVDYIGEKTFEVKRMKEKSEKALGGYNTKQA